MKYLVFFLLISLNVASCSQNKNDTTTQSIISGNVIYGDDNRLNISDTEDIRIINKAQSIAVMTFNHKLRENRDDSNYFKYSKTPAFVSYDICNDEPFAQEFILGNCTGFLISENLLLTAGHCISSQETCEYTSWVFDQVKSNGLIKKSNTYQCKKLIKTGINISKTNHFYQDYTIIELENKTNTKKRPFLKLSDELLNTGDELYTIGSPFGTPLKYAGDAYITSLSSLEDSIIEYAMQAGDEDILYPLNKDDYLMTNLDTFSGNSGSPIFSKKSGNVIGILSSGSIDWDFDEENFCQRSRIKPMNDFGEEAVFKTIKIQDITELTK